MDNVKDFCLEIPSVYCKEFRLFIPYYCELPPELQLEKGDIITWKSEEYGGSAKVLYSEVKNGVLVCTFAKIS